MVDVFQVVKTLRKERQLMFSSLVGTRKQSVSLLQLKTEKAILALHLNTSAAAFNDTVRRNMK